MGQNYTYNYTYAYSFFILCIEFHAACMHTSGVPRNFVWGGVQQIQLRTEDRQNGDLVVVAP